MGTAATTAMVGTSFYHKAWTKSSGKSQLRLMVGGFAIARCVRLFAFNPNPKREF
jgi:hypothetical protein